MEQKLVIVPEEATVVRQTYEGCLACGSLVQLARLLSDEGYTTKRWASHRGRAHGEYRLTPKYLYRILANALYTGKITHKEHVWPGQHEPIIEQDLWDRVQQTIEKQDRQTRHRWQHAHLLKGQLKTFEGHRMSPSGVQRPTKVEGQKRIVGYYVSQKAVKQGYQSCPIKTLNARHLDELVRALVLDHLQQHESFDTLHQQEPQVRDHWLRQVIQGVHVAPDKLTLELDTAQIEACRNCEELKPKDDWEADGTISTCLYQPEVEPCGRPVTCRSGPPAARPSATRTCCRPSGGATSGRRRWPCRCSTRRHQGCGGWSTGRATSRWTSGTSTGACGTGASLGLCRDTLTMVRALGPMWSARPPGALLKVGVVLTHLVPEGSATLPLYGEQARLDGLADAMDKLDAKYGRHTLYWGGMWGAEETAPTRISFTQIPHLEELDGQG